MRRILAFIALFILATVPASAQPARTEASSSSIEGEDNQLFLRQTVIVEADLDRTWAMFTTAEGARRWMAPVMEIDLRPGGAMRANYDADAAIGDAGTIENRIVNYVPHRLLTLQADLDAVGEADWLTEEVRANADQLYNIIEFEALDPARTRVTSWGIGYRKGAGWQKMIDFFAVANVWSLNRLAAAASAAQAEVETAASPTAD